MHTLARTYTYVGIHVQIPQSASLCCHVLSFILVCLVIYTMFLSPAASSDVGPSLVVSDVANSCTKGLGHSMFSKFEIGP